jgi:hypothetical protein
MKQITVTQDIFIKWDRTKKTVLAAKTGEKLFLLHDGGTALVVQREDGERFSCETTMTDHAPELSTITNKNPNLLF